MTQPLAPEGEVQSSTTLAIAILCFGLLIVGMIVATLWRKGQGFGNITLKLLGLTIVITATIFLLVIGYSQEQITPAIGLFGTIAGYLLGTNAGSSDTQRT